MNAGQRPVAIFLDDERNFPLGEDWIVVRTVEDMLDLIDRVDARVVEISFDNDLQRDLEGIHGLTAIRERLLDDPTRLPSLERITVHSANSVAADAMVFDLLSYRRHGVLPPFEIRRRPADGDLYPLAAEDDRDVVTYVRPTGIVG
jgi:hypothetical protein